MTCQVSLLRAMLLALKTALVRKVRAISSAHVPQGYQDQTGFHFGVKPAGKGAGFSPSVSMTLQDPYRADPAPKVRVT